MRHHAYVSPGGDIEEVKAFLDKELGLVGETNPDIIAFTYGLLSVEAVRKIIEIASRAPMGKQKAVIISVSRLYHEAQNALLKLFEEPPKDTTLFLIVPEMGQLLPTLRSRLAILHSLKKRARTVSEETEEFVSMSKEKRSAYIKKLSTGKDEDDRRRHRDLALTILNGVEMLAYAKGVVAHKTLLADISVLRGYLQDRSSPVRLILEHLSLVLPRNLV